MIDYVTNRLRRMTPREKISAMRAALELLAVELEQAEQRAKDAAHARYTDRDDRLLFELGSANQVNRAAANRIRSLLTVYTGG